MLNKVIHTLIALLIVALNITFLMCSVVYYQPHSEVGYGVMAVAAICMAICIFLAVRCFHRGNMYAVAAYGISAALILVEVFIAKGIPCCPECEEITAEELGWMNRWIKTSW